MDIDGDWSGVSIHTPLVSDQNCNWPCCVSCASL